MEEELKKPVDGSDVNTPRGESARAEVVRLRALLAASVAANAAPEAQTAITATVTRDFAGTTAVAAGSWRLCCAALSAAPPSSSPGASSSGVPPPKAFPGVGARDPPKLVSVKNCKTAPPTKNKLAYKLCINKCVYI